MVQRKVERTEDVPYDTDIDGNVLTVKVDILECGHKKRRGFKQKKITVEGDSRDEDFRPMRNCRVCDDNMEKNDGGEDSGTSQDGTSEEDHRT